jgi:hypothetical protein
MNKLVLPGQQVSIQLKTGEIDATWYERLRGMLDQLNSVTGGGGGGASITLTGDVTGSGSGTVATTAGKLQGHAVSSTAPTLNQVLEWTGTAWTPNTLNFGQMTWVPYTTTGQAFVAQNLTRDGDWTMVANTATTDRPAPQPTGAEEDLLPAWTPNRQSAIGALVHYNEWTVNTSGWIGQYGIDIIRQNVGDTHAITLSVNGSIRDSFTAVAANEGIYFHDIAPIVVASGSVIRVTMQISATGSNSWFEQVGLFATPPIYCSLAQGSLNGAAAGTTAYGCHLRFTPGTKSPNWDIVAFAGAPGGGQGGGPEPVIAWSLEGNPTASSTTPTAFTIGSLTAKTTPASTDQLLLQDNAASGALKSVPWSSLPSGGPGGGMSIGGAVTGGTSKSVLFIDGSGNLAQDPPHFTFDSVTNYLNVGVPGDTGVYYVNGLPGLYNQPNASGANWFEGNAGNSTLTGYLNFGTGDGCLSALTNGNSNVGLGSISLQSCTTGYQNICVGTGAMQYTTSDSYNIAMGYNAMRYMGTGGAGSGGNQYNVCLGYGALANAEQGHDNLALGANSLSNIVGGTSAFQNTIIGSSAANQLGVGGGSGISSNTFIGYASGANITTGSSNTWIGAGYRGPATSLSNTVVFCDGSGGHHAFLDKGITDQWTWHFACDTAYAAPTGLYVYSAQDAPGVANNYERAMFSFREPPYDPLVIGTQHGGTGSARGVWLTSATNNVSQQSGSSAQSFWIYKTTDGNSSPTNYERGILDWNLTSNVFRLASQAGGTGTVRLIAIDGFQKAGAPAAGDLPSGTMALINDTSGGQTWLVYNAAGTIRKVQLT